MKFVLSFIVIATLFTSCTYYKPCSFQVTNTYPNNTVLIGNVTATTKIVYPFGLGKVEERVPIAQAAKNKLLSTYKLKPNQIFTNITLDYTQTHWLFGYTDRAIINADIVLLIKPGEAYVPNDSLFIIGSKEVNGKKVNLYSQRFNYKWGEKVLAVGSASNTVNKIIELYDDEALIEYYSLEHDELVGSVYNSSKIILPYSQLSKKQK
jgi:hypothetical protein